MTRATILAACLLLLPATPAAAAMEHEEIVARLATGQCVPGYGKWERCNGRDLGIGGRRRIRRVR